MALTLKLTLAEKKKILKNLGKELSQGGIEETVKLAGSSMLKQMYPEEELIHWIGDGRRKWIHEEYKDYEWDLYVRHLYCVMAAQCILDIRKGRMDRGEPIPDAIWMMTGKNVTVLPSYRVEKYLHRAPEAYSGASCKVEENHPELIEELENDPEVWSHIHDFFVVTIDKDGNKIRKWNPKFFPEDIMHDIEAANGGQKAKVRITRKNLRESFEWFVTYVMKIEVSQSHPMSRTDIEKVWHVFSLFLLDWNSTIVTDHQDKRILMARNSVRHPVDEAHLNAFMDRYERPKPDSYNELTEAKCEIVEEIYRRFHGEFYTPDAWKKEAKKRIEKAWPDQRFDAIWDSGCGTNPLSYEFSDQNWYASTKEKDDISDLLRLGMDPNRVFVYNFLNQEYPQFVYGVIAPLQGPLMQKGAKILHFNNPPYAGPGNDKQDGKSKKDVGRTLTSNAMKEGGLGSCANQLYAQWFYKIIQLKKTYGSMHHIAMFVPALLFTGPTFESLRRKLYANFRIVDGFIFQASDFADIKASWPIVFVLLEPGTQTTAAIEFDVCTMESQTREIKVVGRKILSPPANQALSQWVKEPIKKMKRTIGAVPVSSFLKHKPNEVKATVPDALGYFTCKGNSVQENDKLVYLTSTPVKDSGCPIHPKNLMRCVASFTAHRVITGNAKSWVNAKDEYSSPVTAHPDFLQWANDCLVHSLFNSQSSQSSLRKILHLGKQVDIYNHFFFMDRAEMCYLANEVGFVEMYQDTQKTTCDPYVQTVLKTMPLSQDAEEILEEARKLVRKSMTHREYVHKNYIVKRKRVNPHLHAWDAGWKQIKLVVKEYYQQDLEDFTWRYKQFEERMREGVHKFGFLKDHFTPIP